MAEASALDSALDIRLSEVRAAYDRGELTTREAADARIAAMEEHLDRVRALRAEHFGGDDA
jgi:hypothetical protein